MTTPCTPEGRPILLTIEDACPQADLEEGGVDCGACRHFRPSPAPCWGCAGTRNAPRGAAQPEPRGGETMMRKKIVSLCMALALCLGLLPVSALAAEEIKLL